MRPRRRPLVGDLRPTALATLVLAGCAGVSAPEPPPVDLEPPAQWAAGGSGAPATAAEQDPWWTAFGDPRLDELIREALAKNRDLIAAAARVDAALAQARIAGAALKPQADFDLTPARRRQNFIGFPIPSGTGGVLSTTTTTAGANLNVSWEVDLWGRLRAGRGAARSNATAAAAELAAAELSLSGQTAKAWFAILEATRQVELARETLDNRRLNHDRIRRRYRRGLRPALDLRLAASSQSSAAALLAQRERQLDAARRQLELLLFRYPGAEVAHDIAAPELPPPPAAVPAGLPAEILTRRPDLVAGEQRLAAAGFVVAQARASLYPQLRLTGSAGRLSREAKDLLDSDFSVWSLAANLLQPLFQGGRLRAGVDLSEALHREVAAGYAQRVLAALAEVESALAAERFLAEQQEALAEASRQAVAAQVLAEDRYQSGLGDYLAVLEAQSRALTSQSLVLDAARQRLAARVDLHLALGGGIEIDGQMSAEERL